MRIAIDASRSRSGGSVAHLIGILSDFDPKPLGITRIHVWAYDDLLKKLPKKEWIEKKTHPYINSNIIMQVIWQRYFMPKILKESGIDVLLSTDASTVGRYTPNVVMSRDMLSFEQGEMERFGFSLSRMRLLLIKYLQIFSLSKADKIIFLTNYAKSVISPFLFRKVESCVINHGVSTDFREASGPSIIKKKSGVLDITYVSNADFYKHQDKVMDAVFDLINDGWNIKLNLIGALSGRSGLVRILKHKWEKMGGEEKIGILTPVLDHQNIPSILKNSDIFLFASSCENMPNTLIEAMASGLPICCSNRGPMPEVLGDGGVYFDPESSSSIKGALLSYLNNSNLRMVMANRALEISKKFSWRRCGKNTFEVLVEVGRNSHEKI